MKKTPVHSSILPLSRVLILGAGLISTLSCMAGTDDVAGQARVPMSSSAGLSSRHEATIAKLRDAKIILDPHLKIDESAREAQRLVGTIEGETSIVPALKKFLLEIGADTLEECLAEIKHLSQDEAEQE